MLKMMYSYKTAEGRGAERHLRVKTADGCKAGWTCAKHAPQRGEDSMGRVRINYLQIACVNLQKPHQSIYMHSKHFIVRSKSRPKRIVLCVSFVKLRFFKVLLVALDMLKNAFSRRLRIFQIGYIFSKRHQCKNMI